MENAPLDNPLNQPLNPDPTPPPSSPLGKAVLINFLVALGYTGLFALGGGKDGLVGGGLLMFFHSLLIGFVGFILVVASPNTRQLGLGFLIAGVLLFIIGFGVCTMSMSGMNFH